MHPNEPAYPVDELQQHSPSDVAAQHFGMTIRMRYAISALTGLLANPNCDYAPMTTKKRLATVKEAWDIADEMILYEQATRKP